MNNPSTKFVVVYRVWISRGQSERRSQYQLSETGGECKRGEDSRNGRSRVSLSDASLFRIYPIGSANTHFFNLSTGARVTAPTVQAAGHNRALLLPSNLNKY